MRIFLHLICAMPLVFFPHRSLAGTEKPSALFAAKIIFDEVNLWEREEVFDLLLAKPDLVIKSQIYFIKTPLLTFGGSLSFDRIAGKAMGYELSLPLFGDRCLKEQEVSKVLGLPASVRESIEIEGDRIKNAPISPLRWYSVRWFFKNSMRTLSAKFVGPKGNLCLDSVEMMQTKDGE